MKSLFELAVSQRPKLADSLSFGVAANLDVIPKDLHCLYGSACGTPFDIKDQSVMDLVPGYRMIHYLELEEAIRDCNELLEVDDNRFFPFLANYSSCYFALNLADSHVYNITPVDGEEPMAESVSDYIETIKKMYQEGIYFLDDDGYLDYDMEREGLMGARMNPSIEYWK